MLTDVDLQLCSSLLRELSNEIAAHAPRSARDSSVAELIGHVRGVGEAAAERLNASLADHYPAIAWTNEDARPEQGDYWLYDPIDGAYHYLQGLPLWSSSLVLVQAGRPRLSIVHDATRDEMFVATETGGATCNGTPLIVSPKSELAAAVVGTAIPPLGQWARQSRPRRWRCSARSRALSSSVWSGTVSQCGQQPTRAAALTAATAAVAGL